MKEDVQNPSSCFGDLQKGVIKLTNQLLKGFQISKIVYFFIKILEHMQMISFLSLTAHNNSDSILSMLAAILKYISFDALIQLNPAIFAPLLYALFSILVMILALAVLIGIHSDWNKKAPYLINMFTPIVCYFLYLFKTVLFIPLLKIIGIAIIPSFAAALGIPGVLAITQTIGILLCILFVVFFVYILVFFKDANPFSQLPYAGQTTFKGLLWMLFKSIMVISALVDRKGEYQFAKTAAFTGIFLIFILYSHYEIGLYKSYFRQVENYFLYTCFIFGVVFMTDYNHPGISSTTYIVPLNILAYLACRWVIAFKVRRIQAVRFLLIEDPKELEEHIINLIQLIDGVGTRDNRVALTGYIQYHQRQCSVGETCPCRRLCLLKDQNKSHIQLQAFKFVIVLLNESKRKFPNYNRIDLLLGLLYHYRIKNSLQAVYAITKMAASKDASCVDKLYEYHYLQIVEREMMEMEVGKRAQINKYFEYTNRMVDFQNNVESCTKHHIEFWKLVMDINPDIRHLEDLGTQITRSKDQLKSEFETIVSMNQNSVHLLTIYGRFRLEVSNQESYNVKSIEKAEAILKNIKESSKIDDKETKYDQNSSTAVVIISGDDGRIGNVVHTNNLVKDLIGYQRSELLEKNVAAIMPKIYGEHHDQVLQRYIGSSENKVNGHERVVPALTKDGFMLPVTALTKVLPSLINGIQIVAFIAKFQQVPEQDQILKTTHFLLYRSDTERIMGVSEGCYSSFGISPQLMYGHPSNLNNELTIEHLFDMSIEKAEDGKIASSLEMGEIFCTINTKELKNEFVVNNGSKKAGMEDQNDEQSHPGTELEVSIKLIQSTVYNSTPLKMLGINIRDRKAKMTRPTKNPTISKRKRSTFNLGINLNKQSKDKQSKDTKSLLADETGKAEGDDFKDLKDFKNFISIKREPSAITAMNTICLLFIVILICSIIGLIFNYMEVGAINKNIIQLQKLTLETEMVTPQLLHQIEKKLYAYELAKTNTTGFTSISSINQTIETYLGLAKKSQLSLLPYKYFFDQSYNTKIPEYEVYASGSTSSQLHLEQQVINDYITIVETMIRSDLSLYSSSNATQQQGSNIYQQYNEVQLNMLYSIRSALNASNEVSHSWYSSKISFRKTVIIVVNSIMMGVTILWVVLLLPYILSVTKINNRVLSLFTLIPSSQISKLIYSCLTYLHENLKEAVINYEQIDFYDHNRTKGYPGSPGFLAHLQHQRQRSNFTETGIESPSQFNMSVTETHGQLRRGPRYTLETDNMVDIQDKFQKMNNSEDRNKQIVICKFVVISLLILVFAIFNLFFSLSIMTSTQSSVKNYQLIGRRPALIRNVKMLLTEYLTNPTRQPIGFSSIRTLNQDIINQFYTLEANLLYLSLENYADLYNTYNNGDCCSTVSAYSSYAPFNEQLTTAECLSLNAGVFKKGLKTGVVSVLEDLRAVLSQYPTTVPQNVRIAKILEYDQVVKYIETPMLAVMSSVEASIESRVELSKLIIVLSGSLFILILLLCWKLVWTKYLSTLNTKIWRTKGLLNLIPMRIITANNHLKNEFTSGQLQNAVR